MGRDCGGSLSLECSGKCSLVISPNILASKPIASFTWRARIQFCVHQCNKTMAPDGLQTTITQNTLGWLMGSAVLVLVHLNLVKQPPALMWFQPAPAREQAPARAAGFHLPSFLLYRLFLCSLPPLIHSFYSANIYWLLPVTQALSWAPSIQKET